LGAFQFAMPNFANLSNISALNRGSIDKAPVQGQPPYANILNLYNSFNYIFTLSVLDNNSLNFPDDTYRAGKFNELILMSGSGNPDNRINTAYGKFEFFLDNLKIDHRPGFDKNLGNTNATGFSFQITEPYSMGIFMIALQKAAKAYGHDNYLDAPYLLTIDFTGHTDDALAVPLPTERRMYPLRFREVSMKVTHRGSVYDISAYPHNEQAFSSLNHALKSDTAISCNPKDQQAKANVQEMLQTGSRSLQKIVNEYLKKQASENKEIADQIVILFPQDLKSAQLTNNADKEDIATATKNPNYGASGGDVLGKLNVSIGSNETLVQEEGAVNALGIASMGFSGYRGGDSPFGKDNVVYDQEKGIYTRGNLTIDPQNSIMQFSQDSDISTVINQVLLLSTYGQNALTQVNEKGMVDWWRIDTQVYQLQDDSNSAKKGRQPKLIVYRVVPYAVSAHYLIPVNKPITGLEQMDKAVCKEYNYTYTGKNLDILDFNITLNTTFYKAFQADNLQANQDIKSAENFGSADAESQLSGVTEESGAPPQDQSFPMRKERDITRFRSDGQGGGGKETVDQRIARNFMDAVTEGADMLNLDMRILGDPYYLGDSGMGNYTAPSTDLIFMNGDGAMDYQSNEVYIRVNFRTPTDIDQERGIYKFGAEGGTELVQQYSGLYKVNSVNSEFAKGKFTQTLSLQRIPSQENKGEVPDATGIGIKSDESVDPEIDIESDDTYTGDISDEEAAANRAALGDFEG